MTFDALEEMTIEMGCWNSKGKVRKSKAREMMQKNSSAHGEGSGAGKPGVYAKKPGNSSSSKKKTGGSQSRTHKGHKPGGSVPPSKRPSKRPSASSSAAAVAAAEADPQGAKELDDLDKHGKMQAKRMKERRKCPHKRGGKGGGIGGGSAGGGQPLIVSGKGESRKPAPAKKDPHGPPIIVSGKSSRNPSRAKASSSASASRSGGSRASSSSSAGISREERKSRAGKVVDEYRDGFRGGDSPSPSRGKPRGSSERPSIRDPKQPRPPPPSPPPPPPPRPPQQKGGGGPKLENDGYLKKQPKPENVINFQGGASGKTSAARGEAGSRHEHHPPARRSKMGAHIASRMPRKSGRRKERSESESKTGEKGGPRDLSKMRRNYAEDLVRRSKAPCPPCGDATDCEHVQEDKVPVVSSDSESKYGIDVKPEPTREELAPMKPKKRMGDVEDIGPPQGFFPPVLDIRLRVGDKEDRPRREVYLRYPHEGAEGHVEVIKGDVAESETAQVDMMQTGGQKPNIEKPKRRSSSRSSRSSAL